MAYLMVKTGSEKWKLEDSQFKVVRNDKNIVNVI